MLVVKQNWIKMTFFLNDFKVTHIVSCNLSGIWSELCYRKAWVENVQFFPSFGMSRDNLKWLLCLRCASFLIVIIIFIVIIIITTIK